MSTFNVNVFFTFAGKLASDRREVFADSIEQAEAKAVRDVQYQYGNPECHYTETVIDWK